MTTVEKITKLFDESGKSANSILKELDFSPTAFSEWKRGKAKPTTDALKKLADYFDVSVDYLLGRTNNPKGDWSRENFPSEDIVYVPIIASVAAGFDKNIKELDDHELQEVPASIIRGYDPSEIFAFIVSGESMSPKFLDGDRVIVVRQDSVDPDDIAIVAYDDYEDGTIKKVSYEQGCDYVDLIPLNSKYEPVRLQGEQLQGCRIIGKVIYLFRAV